MMTALTISEMERVRGQPACGHRLLMVLDEFPALRRMRIVENAAAQIAGFGVKLMFVTQTLAQLKDIYKDNWETLLANAGVKLFFGVEDHFSRDYISKLIGECEVVKTVRNVSSTQGSTDNRSMSIGRTESFSETAGGSLSTDKNGMPSGTSSHSATQGTSSSVTISNSNGTSQSVTAAFSENIQKRALITPDEVGRLFGDRDHPTALALISGQQPLFLTRQFYYATKSLRGFFDPHPDHPAPRTLGEVSLQRIEEARLREVQRQEEVRRRILAEVAAESAAEARQLAKLAELDARDRSHARNLAEVAEGARQYRRSMRIERWLGFGTFYVLPASIAGWFIWGWFK